MEDREWVAAVILVKQRTILQLPVRYQFYWNRNCVVPSRLQELSFFIWPQQAGCYHQLYRLGKHSLESRFAILQNITRVGEASVVRRRVNPPQCAIEDPLAHYERF